MRGKDPALMEECGERLKKVLEAWNITGRELADAVGKTPQQISYIVTGRRMLSRELAIDIARVLNTEEKYRLRPVVIPARFLNDAGRDAMRRGELEEVKREAEIRGLHPSIFVRVPNLKQYSYYELNYRYLLMESETMWRKSLAATPDQVEAHEVFLEAIKVVLPMFRYDLKVEGIPNLFNSHEAKKYFEQNFDEINAHQGGSFTYGRNIGFGTIQVSAKEAYFLLRRYLNALESITKEYYAELEMSHLDQKENVLGDQESQTIVNDNERL